MHQLFHKSRKKVKKYEGVSLKEEKLLAQAGKREVTRKDVIVICKLEKNDEKAIAIGRLQNRKLEEQRLNKERLEMKAVLKTKNENEKDNVTWM